MTLNTSIKKLTSIGPAYSNKLLKLNISTINDLLYHFPTRYEDYSKVNKINSLSVGDKVAIEGTVWQIKNIRTKYGKILTFATIHDGTSLVEVVWFNQPYLTNSLKAGIKIGLAGKVGYFNKKTALINPNYEIIRDGAEKIHTSGLIPIYPETSGLSSKWLRAKIKRILANTDLKDYEFLPEEIIKKHLFPKWYKSMQGMHFPKNLNEAETSRKRFAFEELFLLQLLSQKRKMERKAQQKIKPFIINREKMLEFISSLPFSLTKSQNKSIKEILIDLEKDMPMNRLLQGDVGSGKTVVATIASYVVVLNGYSVVFMAPTEILANQHHQTLKTLLNPYGVSIGIQTASKKTKGREQIIVGTHALIESKNLPKNLGLVIIDEQHRFGVEQRAKLRERGVVSHFLTMSATPIPRTMALTLYGDLDLSVINELPIGRKPIRTYVVPRKKRDGAYDFIKSHVEKGQQVFIICPLIDPSETLASIRSATSEWEKLSEKIFPDLKIGLLHGRLKYKEKAEILTKFKSREIDILVTTPVVEVGIDIPNASIMMIEAAERFGLAQLHQMRGRVGRSSNQSFCLLFTESENTVIVKRLKNLEKIHVGMDLAELDLKLRGPGEIFGTVQHGVTPLKIASFSDTSLIEQTKDEAIKFLKKSPKFEQNLAERFEERNISPD